MKLPRSHDAQWIVFSFSTVQWHTASLETTENLETSTSCAGSEFAVVWFLFVSVLLDS